MTESLTFGECLAWHRHRKGMSQEVLAGLVGRTADWLSKVENDRIGLDRLSVIQALADALQIPLHALLTELPDRGSATSGGRNSEAMAKLRAALMDYAHLPSLLTTAPSAVPPDLDDLRVRIGAVWTAYQQSRYTQAAHLTCEAVPDAQSAVSTSDGDARLHAQGLLAMAYQGAAMVLTKVGEIDLAWVSAERGLAAALESGNTAVTGSLYRSVSHCLLAAGRHTAARDLVGNAAGLLDKEMDHDSPTHLSVYGTLLLVGSMAAGRTEDRASVREFLAEAERATHRLGGDANHMWTSFGPTNVAIHRLATAMELGDIHVAAVEGPRVDTSALPTERRVRHSLEVARAYSAQNRVDEALALILEAETQAPEQVLSHFIPRQLVTGWMRRQRRKPSHQLAALAQRLRVTG
jgi:transcriptional regulator with XRE-family HTH domain